jgi:polar amino acid transport system substrate-binding protein
MMRVLNLLIGSLCLFGLAQAAEKPTITLYADEWCPYNCVPGSATEGYLMELIREALPDYTIKYQVMPWPRAVEHVKTQTDKLAGLLATTKEDTPDMAFPKEPQGELDYTFYTNGVKLKDWIYTNQSSLASVRLGVINDYHYGSDHNNADFDEYVKKMGTKVTKISGGSPLNQLLKMLDTDRLDVIIDDANVIGYTVKGMNLSHPPKAAGILNRKPVYLAFQPKHPDAQKIADRISKATVDMRKDGRLKRILDRYGLSDWAKN